MRKIMDLLLQNEISIDLLTTDRHATVIKIIRQEYPNTKHMYDAWHMVKPFVKDLREEAKKKRSANLKLFVKALKNHFWFSIAAGKGDGNLCREILLSSLFHIIGVHNFGRGNICDQLHESIRTMIEGDRVKEKEFLEKNPTKGSKLFKVRLLQKMGICLV